jgi:two-component system response regulator ChvI
MLLDWRMSNLTGINVLRRMRGAGITIPVIFLTVLSDDIYEQAALEGGAVDFIDCESAPNRDPARDWTYQLIRCP